MNLYEKIGKEKITKVISDFYDLAFEDVLIGHFFFGIDKEEIKAKQTQFASNLLGCNEIKYQGKPLKLAHLPFSIRPPHFRRRQILMFEAMEKNNIDENYANEWLAKESALLPLIINSGGCHS